MTDQATEKTTQQTTGTFRLMYRSHSLIPPSEVKRELGDLFSAARRTNKGLEVVGALLLFEDHFVQVLEGARDVVEGLYAKIALDPRHDDVALMESGSVGRAVFARWSMAEVGDADGADIPLIAHTDGISKAAGHPITPEQDEVLAVMRTAARGVGSGTDGTV